MNDKIIKPIHEEIIKILKKSQSSYASPVSSKDIGKKLNLAPCYIRRQLGDLVAAKVVSVRRGSGGGYYIKGRRQDMNSLSTTGSQLYFLKELRESLADMGDYLQRLSAGLPQIVLALQTGEEKDTHLSLSHALEGIDFYLKLIATAHSILDMDFSGYEIAKGRKAVEHIDELKNVINSLYDAYRNRDFVLTADIIEYELVPVLDTSNIFVAGLIMTVDKKLSC